MRDLNDFEWRQTMKCYKTTAMDSNFVTISEEELQTVNINILDESLAYHNEFLGCQLGSVVWITSDKALLNLMVALNERKAGCITNDSYPSASNDTIDVSTFLYFSVE